MSLANIVSGIVNKESKVDRKKLAYFFRDHTSLKTRQYPIGLLLRVLAPEEITILSVQEHFFPAEPVDTVQSLNNLIGALLPDTRVNIVYGNVETNSTADIVLREDSPLSKEQLMLADVGIMIGKEGKVGIYKGTGVPGDASFFIDKADEEIIEEIRDGDLDVLLPTENMWLVNELTRNREAEIAICYFGTDSKSKVIKKVSQLTSALLNSSIKVCLSNHYFNEDFNSWETEKESVKLFDMQHDFVLTIRGDSIDVHLPFENGAVSKTPNGWLLLN